MSELGEKLKQSIERLRAFEPKNGEGYYLAFSGGKDSVAVKAVADMAGVKYDAHYNITTVDPPELVRFVKEKYPDVQRDKARWDADYKNPHLAGKPITMWNLIPERMMPPTQLARYCCQYLKEGGGDGRMTITGVRWAESRNRRDNQGHVTIYGGMKDKEIADDSNFKSTQRGGVILANDNEESRRVIESCYKRRKTVVNPIIEWTDDDVWEFIRTEKIPYCELYDCGFRRLGCIGCPMASTREREKQFALWPKFKDAYLMAFDKMLQKRIERNRQDQTRPVWRYGGTDFSDPTAMDVFNWWMRYDILPGQVDMFGEMEEP